MRIENGGPNGANNILDTHPTHRKLSVDHTEKKKPASFLPQDDSTQQTKPSTKPRKGLQSLSCQHREDFLSNLIDAHGHRINLLKAEDLKTAFKSLQGIRAVPVIVVHENESAIRALPPGHLKSVIITVKETIAALS